MKEEQIYSDEVNNSEIEVIDPVGEAKRAQTYYKLKLILKLIENGVKIHVPSDFWD